MIYSVVPISALQGFVHIDNPTCKTEKETQMYRTDFWTLGEGEGRMI